MNCRLSGKILLRRQETALDDKEMCRINIFFELIKMLMKIVSFIIRKIKNWKSITRKYNYTNIQFIKIVQGNKLKEKQ